MTKNEIAKAKNCLGEIQAIKETLKALEDNITKLLSEKNQSSTVGSSVSSSNKKRIVMFIDSENFSHNKIEELLSEVKKIGGVLSTATIYDRPDNKNHFKEWGKVANKYGWTLRQVQGKKKNAVDNIIINDIHNTIGHRDDIDIICLASADGGYAPILKQARNKGKTVVVIHSSSVSKKLQKVSNRVIKIS